MNSISNINAKFIDQSDNVFFEGWDDLLNANFISIPALDGGGYTKNHFFEFSGALYCNGCDSNMTMHQRIISTPLIIMVKFPQLTRG